MPEALFQRGLRSQIGFRFHGAMISAGIRAAVTNQLPVPPGSDRSRGCPYESGPRSQIGFQFHRAVIGAEDVRMNPGCGQAVPQAF